MLTIIQSSQFKRDIKRAKKRGKQIVKLENIIRILLELKKLPDKNRDHELIGNWLGYRECHIEPDWLLIYKIEDDQLRLARTGSHSDLFF